MANLFRCTGGSSEKKDVIPPDLYLYKDGEMLNGGVTFNTFPYDSLAYGKVTQESTRVFLYTDPYPSASSIVVPEFQYDDYSALYFEVQEPTLNNGQKFVWKMNISSWTGKGRFALFKGGSDGNYWIGMKNDGGYPSGIMEYNGKTGTGQYMYISRVWLVPKYEKYLYKDGNVQEQTVPLYTDGVQDVEWENTNQRLGTQYEVGGTTTFAEANIVQTALSHGPTCTVLTTKEAVDLTDCSRVWWICSVNNQTYKRYVDVTSLSGAYYLSITSADFSGSWNRQFFVSNTKENVETNRAVSGVFMDNYEQHSSNYPMYVQRVWLEKSVAKATDKDAVDWDNRGYNGNSSFQSEGGLNITDNGIVMSAPSANYSKSIVNNIPVDVSNYSTLKILYNNTSVVSADISAIKGAIYLTLTSLRNSSNYYNIVYCSNAKTGYNGGTGYISQQYIVPTATSAQTITINRIWLEK